MEKYLEAGIVKEYLGDSVEGRAINKYSLGSGNIKVLLWTQMHGNESTATRAILDICSFFTGGHELKAEANNLLKKLTIKIIPMLNPDGGLKFERRNALGIDLNRDARELAAPESRMLKKVIDDFKPDFAFNLHDQRRFYNVKGSGKPATVSFLAPAFDAEKKVNHVRLQAMQVIVDMYQTLQSIIPGQVGIYKDEFSPRAFGDITQKRGSSTILIESGWTNDDPEKDFVRKLTTLIILTAVQFIADDGFDKYLANDYFALPDNDEKMFDLLLRNVIVKVNNTSSKVDLGIGRKEILIPGTTRFYTKGLLSECGDLKDYFGFETIDSGQELTLSAPLITDEVFSAIEEVTGEMIIDWLTMGVLYVRLKYQPNQLFTELPINFVSEDYAMSESILSIEQPMNFLLRNQNGEIAHRIMNGFVINLKLTEKYNGLILK